MIPTLKFLVVPAGGCGRSWRQRPWLDWQYEAGSRRSDRAVHLLNALGGCSGGGRDERAPVELDRDLSGRNRMVSAVAWSGGGTWIILIAIAAVGPAVRRALRPIGDEGRGEFHPLDPCSSHCRHEDQRRPPTSSRSSWRWSCSRLKYILTGIRWAVGGRTRPGEVVPCWGAVSSAFFLRRGSGLRGGGGTRRSITAVALRSSRAKNWQPRGWRCWHSPCPCVGFEASRVSPPFHMWTPDAHQGAPTPVNGVHVGRDEGVPPSCADPRPSPYAVQASPRGRNPVMGAGGVSMVVGSVAAIAQSTSSGCWPTERGARRVHPDRADGPGIAQYRHPRISGPCNYHTRTPPVTLGTFGCRGCWCPPAGRGQIDDSLISGLCRPAPAESLSRPRLMTIFLVIVGGDPTPRPASSPR